MQMYEEVEQILDACTPAIPSAVAIGYLTVRPVCTMHRNSWALGDHTCVLAAVVALPAARRWCSATGAGIVCPLATHSARYPPRSCWLPLLTHLPPAASPLPQAWQRADADTKRCQYSSLKKRRDSGRTAEIATCINLWLGAAAATLLPQPAAQLVAAQPVQQAAHIVAPQQVQHAEHSMQQVALLPQQAQQA